MHKGDLIAMSVTALLLSGCPRHNNAATSAPAAKVSQKSGAESKDDSAFNKYYTDAKDSAVDRAKPAGTFSMRKPDTVPAKKPETTSVAAVPVKKPAVGEAMPDRVVAAVPAKPRTPTPDTGAAPAPAPAPSPDGRFTVQVASTPSNDEAQLVASKFKKMGYEASILEVRNPRPDLEGTFYRVRVGSFTTGAEAKSFGERVVVPAHFDFWVVHKSNEKPASAVTSPREGVPARVARPSGYLPQAVSGTSRVPAAEVRRTVSGVSSKTVHRAAVNASPSADAPAKPKRSGKGPDSAKTAGSTVRIADSVAPSSSGTTPAISTAGMATGHAAGQSAAYPTFDQLMKAIDDDQRKSGAAQNTGARPDSLPGR